MEKSFFELERFKGVRRMLALVTLALATLAADSAFAGEAAASAPASAATTPPPPGYKLPPPPANDAIRWNGDEAEILDLTPAGKAEVEAKADRNKLRIVLRDGATDAQLARLASMLSWAPTLITGTTTAVSDLSPLRKMTRLKLLHLNDNRVTTLRGLANHPSLETLVLTCTDAFKDTDLSALAGIKTLRSVELRGCRTITSLHGLEGLSQLASFSAWQTPFRDLEPLRGKTAMGSLWIDDAPVADVSVLASLPELRVLNLSGIHASDFSSLRGLSKMVSLNLSRTGIRDLGVLAAMTNLDSLELDDNHDLVSRTFPALPKLMMLGLSNTNFEDVRTLAAMSALRSVSLDGTRVKTIKPLLRLKELTSIVAPEGISDAELRAARRALPNASVARFGKPLPEDVRPAIP